MIGRSMRALPGRRGVAPEGPDADGPPDQPRPSLANRLLALPVRLPYRIVNRFERRRFAQQHQATIDGPVGEKRNRAIVRVDGVLRVAEIRPGLEPIELAAANLDIVTAACERGGIPYFAVASRDPSRPRIGVPGDAWDRLLDELAAAGQAEAAYCGVTAHGRGGRNTLWAELLCEPQIVAAAREQNTISVFRLFADSSSTRPEGMRQACQVEKWTVDDTGGISAPVANQITSYIGSEHRTPARTTLLDRELPTLEPFTAKHVFDIDFAVDAVVMWVDGNDPAWQAKKRRALAERTGGLHEAAVSDSRFRDHGELRFALRSIDRYAPWVDRVFLVTDAQVPDWLDRSARGLTLVDHRELFGDAGRLPTFNSQAIAGRIHHIEGLNEHYVICNDDVFFGRLTTPDLFFLSNGMARFGNSRVTLPFTDGASDLPHEAARRNSARLIERDFGRLPTQTFFHTPVPQLRSMLFELEDRYREAFERTWSSQFRAPHDIEINSWLHHYYGYLTGRAVPGSLRYDYFRISSDRAWSRMRALRTKRNLDVFCINDDHDAPEAMRERRITRWLAEYFPDPSRFERR